MKTVTESDISEAQANMQFVQALAAAGGDFRRVNMPDEDLAKVTEVVFPDGVRLNGDVNSDYNLQNYPFTRMPRLRKLVIRDPDTLLPNGYFCHMNSPEAEVELPYSAMRPSMFASAKLRLVKLTATSRFGSRLRDVSLHHSFYHCEAERVELPEGLSEIKTYAFYYSRVADVDIPSTVRLIQTYAFCGSWLREAVIPEGCSVCEKAFCSCSRLEELDASRALEIQTKAFFGCQAITNVECNARSIGEQAFSSCHNLRRVEFGPDVQQMGQYAFSDCTSLKAVALPMNVQEIGYRAFYGCKGLVTVALKNQQANVRYPFMVCPSLKTVCMDWNVPTQADGEAYLRQLGLTDSQVGTAARRGQTAWVSAGACSATATRAAFTVGPALAEAGVQTVFNRGVLRADFGPEGMTPDVAEVLQRALAAAGNGVAVVFADGDRKPLTSMSDLSDIKSVLFRTA